MSRKSWIGQDAETLRQMARDARQRSYESFQRSDTDGFRSQGASDTMARVYEVQAGIAENGGTIEMQALFNLDGTIASTHNAQGQWGWYWVLNDAAAARFGKRFFNESKAGKAATRNKNNRAKGFTVGTIRVKGYADVASNGNGAVALPVVECLKNGEFEIVGVDTDDRDY